MAASRYALAFMLLALMVALDGSASAEPRWLPLDVGNRWSYVGVDLSQTEEITGTISLFGRTLYVKTYQNGPDAGLENYWEPTDDGTVRLGGFRVGDGSLSIGYDPPLLVLATPPSLGLEWVTHAATYSLPDLVALGPIDIGFRVTEDVELQVPAGAFPCFGVGQMSVPPARAATTLGSFTLDGRHITSAQRTYGPDTRDWYSAGVGVVQYSTTDLYQLQSFDRATPTVASTWGRLKRLYR